MFKLYSRKVSILIITIMVVSIMLGGCNSTANEQPATTQESAKKMKIALVMGGISHDTNVLWHQGAIDGLKEIDAEYVVYNAENDRARTVNYIEDAIQQKVDAILVANVFTDSVEPIIASAKEQGIPTFSIDAGVPSAVAEITSDNEELGKMIAEEMVKQIGGKGNIVSFYTPGYKPIDIRRQMLDEVLKKYPDVKIIADMSYAWPGTEADTQAKMEALLTQYPEKGSINAVWGCFDLCTVGAIQAVMQKNRTEVYGYGIDGDKIALEMISQGTPFKATILQNPYEQGRAAAHAAGDYLTGKNIEEVVYVPVELITQENASKAIETINSRLEKYKK